MMGLGLGLGLGLVHLASWLVSDRVASGQPVCLFPDDRCPVAGPQAVAIHAVRFKGRSHAAKAQRFIAHLKKAFGSPAYGDRAEPGSSGPGT